MRSFRHHPVWIYILCCLSMLSLAFFVNIISVYLTTLSAEFGGAAGLTKEQLGRIAVFSFAGVIAGILSCGALADRWGARIFAAAGNWMIAAGMILCSFAPSYPAFLACMFVIGFGAGCLDLILTPVVVALYPERKSAVLNWLHSFYPIGGIVTILICGYAIQRGWNWRHAVFGLSILPLAAGVGMILSKLPALVLEEGRRQKARDLVRKPVFILLVLGLLLAGIPEIGINVWLPAYSELELKLPAWQANLGLVLFTSAMAVGRILNGWLSRRINVRYLMIAGCLVCIVFYLLASLAADPGVSWMSCVVIGFGVSCLWPGILSLTSERFPRAGASVYAVLSAVANVGGMLTPWGIGLGGDVFGLRPAMAMVGFFPLLMIVLLLVLRRYRGAEPNS